MNTFKDVRDKNTQNKGIESLQASFLAQHFCQITAISSKHYRFAFSLLQHIYSLHPSFTSYRLGLSLGSLQKIVSRKKRQALQSLVKWKKESVLDKNRAVIKLMETLLPQVIPILKKAVLKIKRATFKSISKDKHLFLLILLSNLNKIVSATKIEAFLALKAESQRQSLSINKAKVLALQQCLTVQMHLHQRWAFNNLRLFSGFASKSTDKLIASSAIGDLQDDSGEEEILSQCYKSMACSLKNMLPLSTKSRAHKEMKRQVALTMIYTELEVGLKNKLEWAFEQLVYPVTSNAQTLQLLRRQIAILQKQYQSN